MSTPPNSSRGLRWARELALTAGAIAGLVCIIAAVGALAFGVKPVIFRSGSMSPTIPTGALALARTVPAADISTGDVVSVTGADGVRLTHRVVAVDSITGNTAMLRLQGDANAQPDPEPYAVAEADRVILHVNRLGYVVAWLSSPAALIAAGLLGTVLVVAVQSDRRRARPDQPPRTPDARPRHTPRHRAGAAPAVAGVALLLVVSMSQTPGTYASFTSSATANAGPFAASKTFAPRVSTAVSCATTAAPLPATATLTWKHAGPAYDYQVVLRDLDGTARGEWTVDSPSLATMAPGADVSQALSGSGLAGHTSIWEYNAEIHTVLRSSGEVSVGWAGHAVYQDAENSKSLRCSGRGPQDETTPPYQLPARPTSLKCETQGILVLLRSAKLTWTGNAHRYRVIVTEQKTGTVVLQQADTAEKTTTLGVALLDLSLLLNPSEFIASVYSVDANGVLSAQALSRPMTTNLLGGLSGLGCNPDGSSTEPASPATLRMAPVDADGDADAEGSADAEDDADANGPPSTAPATSTGASPTKTPSPEASSTPTTSSPAASTTAGPTASVSPTTTPPTTTTAPPTTSTAPPETPQEVELGAPVASGDGAHTAVLVRTGASHAAVVRDASGAEITRAQARSGDALRWLDGRLWIVSADGVSYLDPDAVWSRVIPEQGDVPAEIDAMR